MTSFWTLGELSGEIEQTFTLDNFKDVVEDAGLPRRHARTILIAALVTVTDALLAFPTRLLHGEGRAPADEARCSSSRC